MPAGTSSAMIATGTTAAEKIEEMTLAVILLDWWKFPVTKTLLMSKAPFSVKPLLDNLALLKLSKKITLLFLLALSALEGDKMLVFSQSLYSLN